MKLLKRVAATGALLSFIGGYVDVAGFLGLHGLFAAHITGNFATLCAALVLGRHDLIGKLLALPEFVAVIALARLSSALLPVRHTPARRILMAIEVAFLAVFFALAVSFGPFSNADTAPALFTAFAAIAAMAVQNEMQRVYMPGVPPSTYMTGNATNATVALVGLATGDSRRQNAPIRARAGHMTLHLACFGVGCAAAAALYWQFGFWCLVVPVALAPLAAL